MEKDVLFLKRCKHKEKICSRLCKDTEKVEKKVKNPNHAIDALRYVQSDVFHCRENIHFLLSLDLLCNIEGDTKQSTSFCTIPKMWECGSCKLMVLLKC